MQAGKLRTRLRKSQFENLRLCPDNHCYAAGRALRIRRPMGRHTRYLGMYLDIHIPSTHQFFRSGPQKEKEPLIGGRATPVVVVALSNGLRVMTYLPFYTAVRAVMREVCRDNRAPRIYRRITLLEPVYENGLAVKIYLQLAVKGEIEQDGGSL
jgi:hypothetical protein